MKIADFNCAEQCQEPDFEIFDAQGEQKLLPAGPSIGEVDGVGGIQPGRLTGFSCCILSNCESLCCVIRTLPPRKESVSQGCPKVSHELKGTQNFTPPECFRKEDDARC